MKTIGLLGGMSWHSTADYYRLINEQVAQRLGGHHSAKCLVVSLDFEEVRAFQVRDAWDEAGEYLAGAAQQLEAGGADMVLLCTNLMHKAAAQIEAAISIPFLHIADAVGAQAVAAGHSRVGMLGARWVMEETFYKDRLQDRWGIEVIVPDEAGRALVDRVIFDELTVGLVENQSREGFVGIIEGLAADGAQAVLLSCTEIELLIKQEHSPIPVIDSTQSHASAAVAEALLGLD